MRKVFIGLLFVFINFSVNTLNLTPAFVGYILIYLGLGEAEECPSTQTSRMIAAAGAVVDGVLWVLGAFGAGLPIPLGAVFQLLVTYRLVVWAEELASLRGWETGRVEKFRTTWYVLAISVVLSLVLALLGTDLAFAALLAFAVSAVYYTYTYYHIWKDAALVGGMME